MSPKHQASSLLLGSPGLVRWAKRLLFALVLYVACVVVDRIKDRWYVLDPTHLHQLAQAAVRTHPGNITAIIPYIVANLTASYPGPPASRQIALNLDSSEWVLSNAGGAMGAMYIVHASLTEYLFIFGTPLGTEGHTGMHLADDYFHILVGEQWAFDPSSETEAESEAGAGPGVLKARTRREVYRPGDVHVLPRGRVKQYKMHEGGFALEYARGWIPSMMPFGVLDVFSSTLDYWSLYHTFRISVREFGRNLLIGKI